MKNIDMQVTGNKLTIVVDLDQDHGKSASGKSIIIASTEGNIGLSAPYEHVKVGLNIYKK